MWGFISGGLTWFAIPFTLATTMGLAYLGLSSAQDAPMLSEEDITAGLTAPLVAQKILGVTGEYMMIFLILMAVMSTGSAEVIAISSLIIYDIFQTYVKPFRPDLQTGQCILCTKSLNNPTIGDLLGEDDICRCPTTKNCEECKEDNVTRLTSTSAVRPRYMCSVHGKSLTSSVY